MQAIRQNWFLALLGLMAVYAAWVGSGAVRINLSEDSRASTLYGWDTSFYYFWLRSPVLDGDVDFSNDIEISDTLPEVQREWALNGLGRTDEGLIINKYPVGWAVFHLPWFVGGHVASIALSELGLEVRTDGFGNVYEFFLYTGSLFYATLAMWLTYQLLCRFFSWKESVAGGLAVWASGFLIFYQINQYAMSHGVVYLCVASSFYWALAIRDDSRAMRKWVSLGLSVGLLLITRPQAGVYLIYPFLLVVVEILTRRTRPLPVVVCTAVVFSISLIQLVAWKLLFGSWFVYSYEGEGFLWGNPALMETLFDPFHGLVYWHPIFLVGFVGLIGFVVTSRDRLMWAMPVSFLAVIYVNASWENWWYGAGFGGRAYEGATLFACFGVSWLVKRSEEWNAVALNLFRALLLILVLWNIGVLEVCIYNWQTGLSLEEPITWSMFWDAIRERWF